jgi:hypothetical protein
MDDEHRNRLQTIETLLLVLQGDTTAFTTAFTTGAQDGYSRR